MRNVRVQRNTRQREVVLEELRAASFHPTAAELYELARARLPKISLGTVYRNLEVLAENGVIRKLEIAGAEARFDGDLVRHHHVRCIRCGRVDDVRGVSADFEKGEVSDLSGYEILGFRLDFVGVCPVCGGEEWANGEEGDSPREGDKL